jgi:hypothetical protein
MVRVCRIQPPDQMEIEMGLFLSMSGIIGAKQTEAENALKELAATHGGRFEPTTKKSPLWEVLVLCESNGNTTVVYPGEFSNWDDAAAYLSRSLDSPVFSFHIHDDDLWMYVLFVAGEAVDHFNPIPDYWDDNLAEDERRRWAGNAATIGRFCRHVREETIRKYLVQWDLDDDKPGRAYDDDEYVYNDCWQMADFMKKVGLRYPISAEGVPLGQTYLFEVEGTD